MKVTPVKRTSISEQIFEQLKTKIISGELRPGDKLPSEKELCSLYQVSRTTVRQALANLSSLNLIETRFGEGSYIRTMDSSVAMASLLSRTYLSEQSLLELIEFRQIIEPNVTFLACQKADDAAIQTLKDIYGQMIDHQNDLKTFALLDRAFHTEIARISENGYVLKVYEIISDILTHAFSDIVSKRGNTAGLKYHKEILLAFESQDPQKAAAMMQEHMDDLRNDYLIAN